MAEDPTSFLSNSGEQIIHLLEYTGEIFFHYQIQPERRLIYISPAIETLTGYSPSEYLADPELSAEIIYSDDRAQLSADRFITRDQTQPFVLRVHHKRGTTLWLEVYLAAVLNSQGTLIAVKGITRDATERKKIEEALLESQAVMSSIIQSAMDAIIVLDADQDVILFNRSAEDMFGTTASKMVGEPLSRLIPAPVRDLHRGYVEGFAGTEQTVHRMGLTRVTTGMRANGETFPIEASISTFLVGHKRFFTAIIRDITERKQNEDKLIHMSTHDPLTGLFNRAIFEEEIKKLEHHRPSPLSIVIADVDNLKYVNDVYGHPSGDELLRDVAKIFRGTFRAQDIVARLGGDEFGVLLPNSDADMANQIIQRIRLRLAAHNRVNRKLPISLSIGVTSVDPVEPVFEAIKRADLGMYREKSTKSSLRRDINL